MTKITVGQVGFSFGAQAPQVSLLVLGDYSPVDHAVKLLIKAVECSGPNKPCGVCPSCSRRPWKPLSEVNSFDTDQGLGKEAVLKIKQAAESSGSDAGNFRIFVISGVEHMSGQAANTLLKFLEETPPGTYFILTTRQLSRVLPTISSRSSVFLVSPDLALFKEEIAEFCKHPADRDVLLNACSDVGQARRFFNSENYAAFKQACLAMANYKRTGANRMGLVNTIKSFDYQELGLCRRYVFNVFNPSADLIATLANLDRKPLKVIVADELVDLVEGAH